MPEIASRSDDLLVCARATVFAKVDELAEELVVLACQLIQTPSVNPALAHNTGQSDHGEADANRLLAQWLERFGLLVEFVEAAPGRPNVVGVLPGTAGRPSLALNGHVDTVPPGDLTAWSIDPWAGIVRDGHIWGRGATDMKGALAAMAVAAGALAQTGVPLQGNLVIQSVVGEETADPEGVRAVLAQGDAIDACINAEPSADVSGERRLNVNVVSNGALVFRVTLRGRSTHAALRHEWLYPGPHRDCGVNALEKGVDLVQALQRLERAWADTKRHPLFPYGKFVLHPGYFHSGPEDGAGPYFPTERCVLEYIVYHHPEEAAADVKTEIAAAIFDWATRDTWLVTHPPELEWLAQLDSFTLDPAHPLAETVRRAHEIVVDQRAATSGFPAGSDATFLAAAGIPTLIYGPGDIAMAHAVDERVPVTELVQAAKVYAATALEWCRLGAARRVDGEASQ